MTKLIPGVYLRGSVYWFNYQIGGKRTRVSLETADLSKVPDLVAEIRGSPVSGAKETIAAMIDSYTADKVKNNKFTDTTRRAASHSLNDLGVFCTRLPVGSVKTAVIQNWFNKVRERSSEATAQTHLNRVKGFFK